MGVSDEQIRGELLASGWQPAMVDQVFAQLSLSVSQPSWQAQPSAMPPKRGPNKKLVTAAAAVVVMIVLAVGAVILVPRLTHKTDKTPTTSNPTQSAVENNQTTVKRRQAVQALAVKISEYQVNNSGVYPATIMVKDTHTVRLCDAACDDATASDASLDIDVSGVELHAYTNNLRAPNSQAIYVVPAAACNQDKTGVVQSSSRALAFLYLVPGGKTYKQECVDL
jgi:hypothetical protein